MLNKARRILCLVLLPYIICPFEHFHLPEMLGNSPAPTSASIPEAFFATPAIWPREKLIAFFFQNQLQQDAGEAYPCLKIEGLHGQEHIGNCILFASSAATRYQHNILPEEGFLIVYLEDSACCPFAQLQEQYPV